jgi:predicted ribosomally synthesized peptide with SipW-like signal peptide
MTKRTKSLLIAFGTMAVCGSLIAGSTYALFTASHSVNIAVTSGKVEVSAEINNLQVYSAVAEGKLQDEQKVEANKIDGSSLSQFADTYYYVQQANNTFVNGGTAVISGDMLSLQNVAPGDKVTFNISVINSSNVAIQYRTKVECVGDPYLFAELDFAVGDLSLNKTVYYVSDWATTSTAATTIIPVTVSLPFSADNSFQNRSTTIRYTVEAVQGNALTTNDSTSTKVEFIDGVDGMVKVEDSGNLLVSIPKAIDDEGLVFANDNFSVTVPAAAISSTAPYITFSMSAGEGDDTYNVNLSGLKANNEQNVTISYKLQAGLKGIMVKYDEIELDSSYNATSGYVTFETSQFGTFTIQPVTEVVSRGLLYGTDDDGLTYYVAGIGTCTDTDIIIPSTYNGKPVTGIAADAFNGQGHLTSVVVPDSVTSIGKSAFASCSNLNSITIPFVGGSATENTFIGYIFGSDSNGWAQMFDVPSTLQTVIITGGSKIYYRAFNGCNKIENIILPDTLEVIEDCAFEDCGSLSSVNIKNRQLNKSAAEYNVI